MWLLFRSCGMEFDTGLCGLNWRNILGGLLIFSARSRLDWYLIVSFTSMLC
jgi:hypothetical protein